MRQATPAGAPRLRPRRTGARCHGPVTASGSPRPPDRSSGHPRPAGHHPAPRSGPHPLRPDGGVALRLLPGCRRRHGRRSARSARTGLEVQLCGDAHLSNFGGFASPERDLIFDVNDFDETIPGPFEWDLKRLAASFEIAGARPLLRRRRPACRSWPRGRAPIGRPCGSSPAMRDLEIWSSHLDAAVIAARWGDQASRQIDRDLPAADGQGPVEGPPCCAGQADHRGGRGAPVRGEPAAVGAG